MGRLDGRVAVVTGAGRGIGAATARRMAAEGAAVVVNDLGVKLDGSAPDSGPAAEVVEEIRRSGGRAVADGSDVSDFAAAGGLIGRALDEFGRIDILVNVAGILRDRMLFNMTEQEWDDVIRVHLRGTFNTMRHASAHWREQRDPGANNRIINFTSRSGLHGAPGQPNYAAAKMGIIGLTYSAAHSLERYGVTVNAIAPNAASRMGQSVPTDRTTQRLEGADRAPDNIAPTVVYLAGTESSWCNGQVLHVDGYQVGLYEEPRVIRHIASPGPWDLDDLSGMFEKVFRPALYGEALFGVEPRRYTPPSKDDADGGPR
ncbi:SDR family NAD(P)-dependent oxidoreductase [Streptosporangium sp. NPDC051022]|uniref:SDR family NAD(P)-dependent oxidoreductase n=1 Tax=Streptosporangium sp. NPDC051022 TaxID=3155752 RepID=UPI00342FB7C2